MDLVDELVNRKVVLDLSSRYVCLGKLTRVSDFFLELHDADLHDLRDSPTTRENYVVAAKISGIKPNRKQVLIRLPEIVAIALFDNIVVTDEESD